MRVARATPKECELRESCGLYKLRPPKERLRIVPNAKECELRELCIIIIVIYQF